MCGYVKFIPRRVKRYTDWFQLFGGLALAFFGLVLVLEFIGIDLTLLDEISAFPSITISIGVLSIQFGFTHLMFGIVLLAYGLVRILTSRKTRRRLA